MTTTTIDKSRHMTATSHDGTVWGLLVLDGNYMELWRPLNDNETEDKIVRLDARLRDGGKIEGRTR